MHPNGTLVATGENGPRPSIVVWSTETMQPVAELKGVHKKAILQLEFSPDGKSLASVGGDTNYPLVVYDWSSGEVRCQSKGGPEKSLAIAYSPDGNTIIQVRPLTRCNTQQQILSTAMLRR